MMLASLEDCPSLYSGLILAALKRLILAPLDGILACGALAALD